MKPTFRLTIVALAGYGAYTLWNRYSNLLDARLEGDDGLSGRRVRGRSELTVAEWAAGSDDPVAQARAIFSDSDERSQLPRTADGIEHRRSEETVEPRL